MLKQKKNVTPFSAVVLMSLLLGLTACASRPPCNREDVQPAYTATGQLRHDGLTITNACFDRMLGDLNACYKKGTP
jgi:type IV pilus biogenesis protein CpaD/CtpE